MRQLLTFGLFFLCFQFTPTLLAQIAPGNYGARYNLTNSFIEYELELNNDNTFTFHFYRKNFCEMCKEENQYGKGMWSLEDNNLVLSTNAESDVNEEFELDLNNSKARLIKKRNSEGVKEEILKFYKSDIFWIKGMELTR